VIFIGKKNGKIISCDYCGRDIYRTEYRLNKSEHQFCSQECSCEYRMRECNEIRFCEYCKKEFSCLKKSTKRFCCNACNNKNNSKNKKGKRISSIQKTCDVCGKLFWVKNCDLNRAKYCSAECRQKSQTINKTTVVSCDYCGKEIRVQNCKYKNCNHFFCSTECDNNYKRGKYLKNSITKEERTLVCQNCGKLYEVLPKKIDVSKFCSRECQREHHKKFLYKTEEYINFRREVSAKVVANMKSSKTKPHIIISDVLKKLNINNTDEKNFKYYSIDIFLEEYNIPIEIHGDFWHCNPTRYNSSKYDKQKTTIIRDKTKHTYIKKYYDAEILYLWEHDIYNNIELCESLIKHYINNSSLDNYNSYNYHLKDNELRLNNALVASNYEVFA
jgi:G:T-mismatch repair DNA endonuclease (very short patch repair protein)